MRFGVIDGIGGHTKILGGNMDGVGAIATCWEAIGIGLMS